MKKFITTVLSVVALWAISTTVYADTKGYGDLVDLGELQLDTEYTLEGNFSDYIGTFTAPTSGTLVVTSNSSSTLEPFHAKLEDMESEGNRIEVNYDNYVGERQYHFDVTEGTTYYFFTSFVMDDFTVVLTMDSGAGIVLKKVSPLTDKPFSISAGGLVTVQFNRAVVLDEKAQVIAGEKSAEVAVNGQTNTYSLEIKEPLFQWLSDSTLKGGDKFIVRLTNIKAADDDTLIYGTDGTADIEFTIADMPISLVSSEHTSGTFKSYYLPGDTTGLVKLHFSGKVGSAKVSLIYGNNEVEGDYYTETLTPTIEGNTIIVDLSGVQRTPDEMVASGTNYNNMTIAFDNVKDTLDQLAYSSGQGSLGGFSFTYEELVVVTANVFSDFVPVSGSSLDEVETVEIWIADEKKLQYDGVLFSCTNLNDSTDNQEIVIANFTKEEDPEDATASILTVPVPTELANGAWNIVVTLNNLKSADGLDHTNDVKAEYHMGSTAIDKVFDDNTTSFTVYNINGILVLTTTHRDEVKNLPNGIYIINGEKFLLTR